MSARIRGKPSTTKKTCGFFLPSARIELLPIFGKKHLILVDKKNIPKKNKFISGNKKNCVFSACFFSSPSLTLFKIDLGHFFYFIALIKFSRKTSKVFYLVALITFSEKRWNVFFFLNVFFTALPH